MRHLSICLLLISLTACSGILTDSNELAGSWKWVQSFGGFAGQTLTPEFEGYTQQLIILNNRRFLLIRNGETLRNGSYTLTDVEIGGQMRPAVEFESDHWETFYEISNDTLFLSQNCRDCFFDTYVRKR